MNALLCAAPPSALNATTIIVSVSTPRLCHRDEVRARAQGRQATTRVSFSSAELDEAQRRHESDLVAASSHQRYMMHTIFTDNRWHIRKLALAVCVPGQLSFSEVRRGRALTHARVLCAFCHWGLGRAGEVSGASGTPVRLTQMCRIWRQRGR